MTGPIMDDESLREAIRKTIEEAFRKAKGPTASVPLLDVTIPGTRFPRLNVTIPGPVVPPIGLNLPGLTIPSPSAFPPTPPLPPADLALAVVVPHPAVVVVLGHRGSGKSAVACRLQELLRDRVPAYGVGLPPRARSLLPEWYGLADDPFDVPPYACVYIPESYRLFHARSTQSAQGRSIGDLVNLSRHRRHTVIFDVQNPAHLDRNIVSEADVLLIKAPGPFTEGFDRPQLRRHMDAARQAFGLLTPQRQKRMVWVVAPASGIPGKLMENMLPSFWSDALSRIFAQARPGTDDGGSGRPVRRTGNAGTRLGTKTPTKDKRARATRLREAGYSYGAIAKVIGLSRSQAFRLVKGG